MRLGSLACIVALTMGAEALVVATDALGQSRPKSNATIDSLEQRVRVDSNDAVIHRDLAMAYWKVKRYDDAEGELQEAVTIAPQYAEAYFALASLAEARGEKYWKKVEKEKGPSAVQAAFDQSARYYRKAFLLNPLVDLRIQQKVEEISEIRDGIYIIRIWWLEPYTKSLNLIREGRYEQAFKLLNQIKKDEKAGDRGGNLPEGILWYHGLTAGHLKRFDDAIESLAVLTGMAVAEENAESSLAVVPLHANDFRYALATMLYLAGQNDQAAPTFRRALEFDVGLYTAHVQLARMLEAEQRWDEAVEERRAAVNANPDDAALLTDLAQTLLRAGKVEDAAEALQLAMATNPRDPQAPYLAGITALRLNRMQEARRAFERFLSLAPSRFAAQIKEVQDQLPLMTAGQ
jgi:tetratricopeptide (TPR) repeat protein